MAIGGGGDGPIQHVDLGGGDMGRQGRGAGFLVVEARSCADVLKALERVDEFREDLKVR